MSEETVKCQECGKIVARSQSHYGAGGWTKETKNMSKVTVCSTCWDNRLKGVISR